MFFAQNNGVLDFVLLLIHYEAVHCAVEINNQKKPKHRN